MKRKNFILLVCCVLLAICGIQVSPASAQSVDLFLRRNFGYGGFKNDIQGLFTLGVKDPPAQLANVQFLLDSQPLGALVQSAPWQVQFTTDDYPPGTHILQARLSLQDGTQLTSQSIAAEFVTAQAAQSGMWRIVLPILGMVALAFGLTLVLGQLLAPKGSPLPLGQERSFGWLGGTICPKCQRPFGLHIWSLNISFAGKFDRCPHCGKWSFVRRQSPQALAEAIARELPPAQSVRQSRNPAEDLARAIEESRYD